MFLVFWLVLHSSLAVFTGKGAMAEVSTIVEAVKQYNPETSSVTSN